MSEYELINLGLDNMVPKDRIIAIARPDTAPIRRLINAYDREDKLINVARGRKTRSVVITDAGYIILSSLRTKTLSERFASSGYE